MTRKVRQALDALEDVLLLEDADAADLMKILSALRGPDRACEYIDAFTEVKDVTTIPVRQKAFPRLLRKLEAEGRDCTKGDGMMFRHVFWQCGTKKIFPRGAIQAVSSGAGNHFIEHIRQAKQAIEREG